MVGQWSAGASATNRLLIANNEIIIAANIYARGIYCSVDIVIPILYIIRY